MRTKFLFLVAITFITKVAMCQNGSSYGLSFENQNNSEHLFIDTISNPNNIWQIGHPQKEVFNSAYRGENVIVTDKVNFYPVNDTSAFILKNYNIWGVVFLSGQYYVNTDSLTDYGKIEFSPDNGTTWVDMLNDTVKFGNNPFSWTDKPILTGNSNGWKRFNMYHESYSSVFGFQVEDTVLYRFSFISDSIDSQKDGLMFDDISYEDIFENIDETESESLSRTCYPNPARNYINFNLEFVEDVECEIEIYNCLGNKVFNDIIHSKSIIELDISMLGAGIYLFKILSPSKKLLSSGRFIKE